MGHDMVEESPVFSQIGYNPVKAAEWLKGAIEAPHMLAIQSGNGFLVGGIESFFFCDLLFARDYVIYVAPDNRGQSVAAALIDAFAGWAEANGVAAVYIETNTGVSPDKFVKMARSVGFVPVGANLVRGIA